MNDQVIFKDRLDALVLPEVGPASRIRSARDPAPYVAPTGPCTVFSDEVAEDMRAAPVTYSMLMQACDAVVDVATGVDVHRRTDIAALKAENAQLRTMIHELKGALAETTAKAAEAFHCWERAAALARGPKGERGAQGVDGPMGPKGEKGERGNRGQAGRSPVAFELSPNAYTATVIFENGEAGPVLNLRPFFAQFADETGASEVDLAAEQEGLERDRLQLEIERVKRGLPARG
jgi:hypothetical protein